MPSLLSVYVCGEVRVMEGGPTWRLGIVADVSISVAFVVSNVPVLLSPVVLSQYWAITEVAGAVPAFVNAALTLHGSSVNTEVVGPEDVDTVTPDTLRSGAKTCITTPPFLSIAASAGSPSWSVPMTSYVPVLSATAAVIPVGVSRLTEVALTR